MRLPAFAFAAMVYVAVPGPLPVDVEVIQGALAAEFQLHPGAVFTLIDPLSPAAAALMASGDTVYTQEGAACETVKVCPPIVRVADRDDPVVFASTVNATLPLPLPLAPDVIVTHAADVEAVQAQPLPAVTATDPDPPPAAIDWLAGLIE